MGPESEKGRIRRVIAVDDGVMRIETVEGRQLDRSARKGLKKKPPEGTIESLFPLLSRALSPFPGIVSEDPNWQLNILEESKYTPEKAVCMLRRHRFSAKETTERTLGAAIRLLAAGQELEEDQVGVLKNVLLEDVKQLYRSTTEVRPRRS